VFQAKDMERPPPAKQESPISSANEESEGDKPNDFKEFLTQ
jgi:hypothetical protein